MSQLFDDSDVETDLTTTNEYAKTYDNWRKKEELNKLKTKYGDAPLTLDDGEESSSSSEDDDVGVELTEDVEKDFYKTLALLKKKDPKIYDDSTVFFTESPKTIRKSTKTKEETMTIKDYERKLLLEKNGKIEDSDEDESNKIENNNPTYVEEQEKLKENLKKTLEQNDSGDEDWGGFLKKRTQNVDEKEAQEADYKAWLAGQTKKLEDEETVLSLKPLKDYWNDPNLEDGEKFLKDYILNKRYLEEENEDYIPTYDEIVHDSDENLSNDENEIDKQEEFEHKFNFRFEEPDEEFIKRYPRTIEHSLRKEDNRRKLKRQETKERKAKEKAEKMGELKKLRELKLKEIEEKIEKLKEITGNKEMAFDPEDLDGDFDPDAHDQKMKALFNQEYYEGPEDDQKPKFDTDDEDFLELEPENLDNWTGNCAENEEVDNGPHCEDDDFIMDADYDPESTQQELLENSKRKKKRRRKSKFVEMLAKDRPKFDPNDKKYEEYLDEYYKLDCEDIIDNIPCRFKYRKVPANSFGLTIEEILMAKDRELNKWCSLKKAVQIRPEHVEKYDQIAYERKSKNLNLKKKILPSLFSEDADENDTTAQQQSTKEDEVSTAKNGLIKGEGDDQKIEGAPQKLHKKKKPVETPKAQEVGSKDKPNIVKLDKKKKLEKSPDESATKEIVSVENKQVVPVESGKLKKKNKKKRKRTGDIVQPQVSKKRKLETDKPEKPIKKFKKTKKSTEAALSDARLEAYGLNPKKFKNKIKYAGKKTT